MINYARRIQFENWQSFHPDPRFFLQGFTHLLLHKQVAMSKSDPESLQAKIVVLGDPRTGKSSLIRALDPYSKHTTSSGSGSGEQTSFTVIEIPSNELDTVANVFLKFWEYTTGKREQEIAFPGALFCIITFDMRAPETANSAFNQWMLLKETQMSESFLFVIGTFLDYSSQRRVEISELCKACAQKEAIYIEVSNLDGSNINLLRRLICQRLNQMLKIRDEQRQISSVLGATSPHGRATSGSPSIPFSEETKTLPPTELVIESVTPSLLERHILSHSIGGIYTSTFHMTTEENEWTGYEKESQNLIHIGKRIHNYIDQISHGIQLPPPPDDYRPTSFSSSSSGRGGGGGGGGGDAFSEPDADEIRHLFDLMGLPLPSSLQIPSTSTSSSLSQTKKKKKVTIKMKVRLPDGSQANLVLRSGDNIEQVVYQFLTNYEMKGGGGGGGGGEGNSLNRLVDIGTAMLRKAEEDNEMREEREEREQELQREREEDVGREDERLTEYSSEFDDRMTDHGMSPRAAPYRTGNSTTSKYQQQSGQPKVRKCKARIKLPNNQVLFCACILSFICPSSSSLIDS
jgi:GTPase SAR1 family protein